MVCLLHSMQLVCRDYYCDSVVFLSVSDDVVNRFVDLRLALEVQFRG